MANIKFGVIVPMSDNQFMAFCSCGKHTLTTKNEHGVFDAVCECGYKAFVVNLTPHKRFKCKPQSTYEVLAKDDRGFVYEKTTWQGIGNKDTLEFNMNVLNVWTLHYTWKTLEIIKVFHNGTEVKWTQTTMINLFKPFHIHTIIDAISTEQNKPLFQLADRAMSNFNMERGGYFGRALIRLKNYPSLQILNACGANWKYLYDCYSIDAVAKSTATTPAEILGIPRHAVKYFITENIKPYREKIASVNLLLNTLGGHNTKELLKIFSEEASVNSLLLASENICQLSQDFGYTNVLQLGTYLARRVKLEQGMTDPCEASRLLRDYVRMSVNLGHEYESYPKSLKKVHDITTMNYKIVANEIKEKEFQQVIESPSYQSMPYKQKDYAIIIPENIKNVIQEGTSLSHCVASYVNDIIMKKCLILFMRTTENIEQSLITIEVRNNEIKQAQGFGHRLPVDEERSFIRKWAMRKGLVCNY